ncbi:MAG TPA: PAAR domain-containing protein [Polyangiaceae bacterium]|jgi:uncharacterized Zn-binding protein involved in type VI secretion|nr:PAAR domain-containing protein [Polyangiaceae bacterium]
MTQPAARLDDKCDHPNHICSGSPDTIIGQKPAARLGDQVTGCPRCGSRRGKIVKASTTVFINSKAAARITDLVECGPDDAPPEGGSHKAVSVYAVKPEDNYVDVVFSDDAYLIQEDEGDEKNPPPPDKPPPRNPATFLDGLSLDIDLGQRAANNEEEDGDNSVAAGEPTVIIGG